MRYAVTLLLLLYLAPVIGDVYQAPIHDAHIHYDEDVWRDLPPAEAVQWLREAGIDRALVSATPTEGAAILYKAAPDRVVPMLRPYKSWRHRYLWFSDPDLKQYLIAHLSKVPYRGFGEFHVFGNDMDTPQIEQMIALAKQRKLVLHPHTDIQGMRILLSKAGSVLVLWAHGGFDVPIEMLRRLLMENPNLYIELSLREAMLDQDDRLTAQWREFLVSHPTRFLVGMDTYKPSRWAELNELVDTTRGWLGQLPIEVAEALSRGNFDRLFPVRNRQTE